jgi:hypothetical protein
MNLHRLILDNTVCFYESCLYIGSDSFSQKVRTQVDNWLHANQLAYMSEEKFVTDAAKANVLGAMHIAVPRTQKITEFHEKYPQTKPYLKTYVGADCGLVLSIQVCFPTPFDNCATKDRFGDADANSVACSLAGYYG